MSERAGWTRRCYRLALRVLYPRRRDSRTFERELEAAALACLERERARLGTAGVVYACGQLALDAMVGAVAARLDRRRSLRSAIRMRKRMEP